MASDVSQQATPGYYARNRPYVVADTLDELVGPDHGTVVLPRHLDWSPRPVYDLDVNASRRCMYETVLREAGRQTDLCRHLNSRILRQDWPSLILPRRVRDMWESRFPELADLRTSAGH